MAIGDYYMDIPNFPEVHPGKEQKWDSVTLFQEIETDVYKPVDGLINRSFLLPAAEVTAICENTALTIAQRRAAILQLVADKIVQTGLVEAWEANQAFLSILPNATWPEGGFTKIKVSLE